MKDIFNKVAARLDKLGERLYKGRSYYSAQQFTQIVVMAPVLGTAFVIASPALGFFGGLIVGGYTGAALGRKLHAHYNKPSSP